MKATRRMLTLMSITRRVRISYKADRHNAERIVSRDQVIVMLGGDGQVGFVSQANERGIQRICTQRAGEQQLAGRRWGVVRVMII